MLGLVLEVGNTKVNRQNLSRTVKVLRFYPMRKLISQAASFMDNGRGYEPPVQKSFYLTGHQEGSSCMN